MNPTFFYTCRFVKPLIACIGILMSFNVHAGSKKDVPTSVSFTADAVQIRGEVVSHAKLFWKEGLVRFDYMETGVSMSQIFDTKNKTVTWLDNENKTFVERQITESEISLSDIKKQKIFDPCKQFNHAECHHLKETTINSRPADKWLITLERNVNTSDGSELKQDFHVFQWIDKEYKSILRQENYDGSLLTVDIIDGQILNQRNVRKLDMHAYQPNGQAIHGIQWYDQELDIVVRQQFQDNFVDELRNIKITEIKEAMFSVPKGYKPFSDDVQTAQHSDVTP